MIGPGAAQVDQLTGQVLGVKYPTLLNQAVTDPWQFFGSYLNTLSCWGYSNLKGSAMQESVVKLFDKKNKICRIRL